jgi:hypothetical protein
MVEHDGNTHARTITKPGGSLSQAALKRELCDTLAKIKKKSDS